MQRLATGNDLQPEYSHYMKETVIPVLGIDPMPLERFGEIFGGAVQELKASGVRRVELVIEDGNARAIGFYRRLAVRRRRQTAKSLRAIP